MRTAWQVLEDGEPPMGGKEPRLRLGAGDGLEQPLVPAVPRPLGQPAAAQAAKLLGS